MSKKDQKQNQYIRLIIIGVALAVVAGAIFIFTSNQEPKMTREEYMNQYISIQDQIVANTKEQSELVSKHFDCKQDVENYEKNTSNIDCERVMSRWSELETEERNLHQQQDDLNKKAHEQGLSGE